AGLNGLLVPPFFVRLTGAQKREDRHARCGRLVPYLTVVVHPIPVPFLRLREPPEAEHHGLFALFAAAELFQEPLLGGPGAVDAALLGIVLRGRIGEGTGATTGDEQERNDEEEKEKKADH